MLISLLQAKAIIVVAVDVIVEIYFSFFNKFFFTAKGPQSIILLKNSLKVVLKGLTIFVSKRSKKIYKLTAVGIEGHKRSISYSKAEGN